MNEEAEKSTTDGPFGENDLYGLACVFWTDPAARQDAVGSLENGHFAALPPEMRQWLTASLPAGNLTVAPVALDGQAVEHLLQALDACLQGMIPHEQTPRREPSGPFFSRPDAQPSQEPTQEGMRPEVAIFTFGRFTICSGGQELALPGRQGDTLCKALLCQPGRKAESAWLAEQLWPDSDGAQAASYLHNAASTLRQVLPRGTLLTHKATQSYQLGGQDRLWVDADAALSLLAQATMLGPTTVLALPLLERAVQFFRRGRFLAGLEETWVYARRLHLETMKERALTWLVEAYRTAGKRQQAESLLFEALCEDPTNETLLRALMLTLSEGGMIHQARLTYEALAKALKKCEMEPEEATTALYEHLRRAPQVFDLASLSRSVLPSLPLVAPASRRSEEVSGDGFCEPILPEHERNDGEGSTALTRPGPIEASAVAVEENGMPTSPVTGERFAPGLPGVSFGLLVWSMRPT